jgi:serine/threonine protein kinase
VQNSGSELKNDWNCWDERGTIIRACAPSRRARDPARANPSLDPYPKSIGRRAMSERRISHYRIQSLLAKGGMGEVYVAEDETLQRKVALKSIRAEFRLDRELRGRFLREARVLSQLDHPGICRVFDYVSEPDADHIVLELIEGRDLRQVIADGVDHRRALELALDVTDALAAAHAAGVIHRDLKPANVMVALDGSAKVLDFGLSRSRAYEEPAAEPSGASSADPIESSAPRIGESGTLIWSIRPPTTQVRSASEVPDVSVYTLPGGLMGTARYMSPEQARGEPLTSASDLYALGLLLQELFSGVPAHPAEASFAEVLERSRKGESNPASGFDGDVVELVERLKALSPTRRPTAVEALQRLQWIRQKPQRRLRRALVAGVVLAAAVGATKYTLDLRRERGRAEARTEAALGMMLTLFDKQIPVLQQVGRLDVLDATAVGVQAYFDRVASDELTDPERVKLARLLLHVGSVREQQGRSEESSTLYQQALAMTEQLVAHRPQDPEALIALGAAHFYIGQPPFRTRSDLPEAERHFRAYLELAQRSAAHDPDHSRAQREIWMARNAVAATLLAQEQFEEALREQEQVVEILRELRTEHPQDAQVLVDLCDNLSWLASAQSGSGHQEDALATFEEELGLRRMLLEKDPENVEVTRGLSFCLTFLAQLHLGLSNSKQAAEYALEARDLLDELVSRDPENEELKGNLEVAQGVLHMTETKPAEH